MYPINLEYASVWIAYIGAVATPAHHIPTTHMQFCDSNGVLLSFKNKLFMYIIVFIYDQHSLKI